MIVGHKPDLILRGKIAIGVLLTLTMTYLSLAIADHVGTPQWVRYLLSPGFVLGMRFASGTGILDTVGSFGRIAITTNIVYFGLINFFVLRRIGRPKPS